jgi:hypothetical protein
VKFASLSLLTYNNVLSYFKGNNTNETVINQPDMKLVLDSTDLAPGRITGSSSIETLIRVGLEKQNNSSLFGKFTSLFVESGLGSS